MSIPDNIRDTIKRIREQEDRWKAYYMAVWGESYRLKGQHFEKPSWIVPMGLGLPASTKGYQLYTPERLHDILTHLDLEIAVNHSINIFSLFERLIKEVYVYEHDKEPPETLGRHDEMIAFLKKRKLINRGEGELGLARAYRNCFVHNGGKADKRFIPALKKARNTQANLNEALSLRVDDAEHWQELILEITKNVEDYVGNLRPKS